jgi:hypothetical protein
MLNFPVVFKPNRNPHFNGASPLQPNQRTFAGNPEVSGQAKNE